MKFIICFSCRRKPRAGSISPIFRSDPRPATRVASDSVLRKSDSSPGVQANVACLNMVAAMKMNEPEVKSWTNITNPTILGIQKNLRLWQLWQSSSLQCTLHSQLQLCISWVAEYVGTMRSSDSNTMRLLVPVTKAVISGRWSIQISNLTSTLEPLGMLRLIHVGIFVIQLQFVMETNWTTERENSQCRKWLQYWSKWSTRKLDSSISKSQSTGPPGLPDY
jgi:hypothetical protein